MKRTQPVLGFISMFVLCLGLVGIAGEKPSVDIDWHGYFKLDGSYNQNLASDGNDDGTDAAIPSIQGRLEVNHEFASGAKPNMGVSGLWGQLKAETNIGNSVTYKSWAGYGHFMLSFATGMGISSEAYTGSNLATYLGGIANNNTVDGVGTLGGRASAWVQPAPKLKLSTGFGTDTPNKDDISNGSRPKNQCFFGNFTYALVPGASAGLELSQWQTEYKNIDTYSSFRAQTSFILNFWIRDS